MTGPVLSVEGLRVGFDGAAVVHDLSLHVEAGEVVALLGPNGAGKTTTLLTISGLLRPFSGTVDVLGSPVAGGRNAHRVALRGLAHVPEDRGLFFDLTVRENLKLGTRPGARGRDRITDALEYFPALAPLLNRKAGLLSGGEQQMLALGRAISIKPRLLLVDEMSLGLAPVIVERLLPVIRRVADDTAAGVLIVEQHVHSALRVADRAYVLNRGLVAFSGTAAALAETPQVLTASYLASPRQ